MKKITRILFSGRVQGVGFRFTARSLASSHSIKGWVKNLADGRVELLAQANPDDLAAFLDNLRSELSGYIKREETEQLDSNDEFSDFTIRFY